MELNLKSLLSLVNVNVGWTLGHVGLIICLILSILYFSMILIRPDRPGPEQEEVKADDKGLDRLVRHCWGPEVISLKQEVRRISLVRQPCSHISDEAKLNDSDSDTSFYNIGNLSFDPIISGESPRFKSLPKNEVSVEKKKFPLYQKVVDELVQKADQPLEKVAAQNRYSKSEDSKSTIDSELTGTSKSSASCCPWLTCCKFGSPKSDLSSAYGDGHFESDSTSLKSDSSAHSGGHFDSDSTSMASEALETGSTGSLFSAAECVDSKTGSLIFGSVKSGISEPDKAINSYSTPNTAISSKEVSDSANSPLKMTEENVDKAKLGQLHDDGPVTWRVLQRKKEQTNVKLQ